MRIHMKGVIESSKKNSGHGDGSTLLNLEVTGKVVDGHRGPDSQLAHATTQLYVKPIILQDHPLGRPLYVIITDKDPDDKILKEDGE